MVGIKYEIFIVILLFILRIYSEKNFKKCFENYGIDNILNQEEYNTFKSISSKLFIALDLF